MRRCPVCDQPLEPIDYEGFRVMHCTSCHGHLVPVQRYESIKRTPGKSWNELEQEAEGQFGGRPEQTLTCPRCRGSMRSQLTTVGTFELQTDLCRECALVWFDGGELALLQLAYQTTDRFATAQEYRCRMEALEASPERKARFSRAVDRLPEEPEPVTAALTEAFGNCFRALLRSRLR